METNLKQRRIGDSDIMEKNVLREYKPEDLEKEIHEYWKTKKIHEDILESKKEGRNYYIVHNPDGISEELDISTTFKSILYDVWSKYQLMNNYHVRMSYGYDTFSRHVRKKVIPNDHDQSEDEQSIEDLFKKWKNLSNELKNEFQEDLKGFRTWENNVFLTSEEDHIESIWWTLKELFDKEMLTEEEKEFWSCLECDKDYSEEDIIHEEWSDNEYIIKIPIKRGENRHLFLKTDELSRLLAPLYIKVHHDATLSVVSYNLDGIEERGIVKKEDLEEIMEKAGIEQYNEINVIPGHKVNEFRFSNPIRKFTKHRKIIREQMQDMILASKKGDKEKGFEIITPGIDEVTEDDLQNISEPVKYELDFEEELGKNIKYRGKKEGSLKDLDEYIESDLKEVDLLLNVKKDHKKRDICPECSSEVKQIVSNVWTIDVSSFKEDIVEISEDTDWIPEWGSPLEDYDSLEDILNWRVSSDRNIGIPFPMWRCECGDETIFSSIDELKNLSDKNVKLLIFPEWLDNLEVRCDSCDEEMAWIGKSIHKNFIKSICTWTQLGYPKDKNDFQKWWPGEISYGKFLDEDGMIFGNLVISSILFEEVSTKTFATHGKIQGDFDVSKIVKDTGYDSIRIGLLRNSSIWEDRDIDEKELTSSNKTIRVLWNIYMHYLNTKKVLENKYGPSEIDVLDSDYEKTSIEDKFILSRLQDLISEIEKHFENHRFDEVISVAEEFILNDVAQWYIGLTRCRIKEGDKTEISSVYGTLQVVLEVLSKSLAPIVPHISERIYREINPQSKSVFEADRCKINDKFKDREIERWKRVVEEISSDIFKLKKDIGLPLKWHFQELIIDVRDHHVQDFIEKFEHVLKSRTKIKDIEIVEPGKEWEDLILTVEANKNAIGKTYRQWASRIALLLENRDAEEMKEKIEEGDYMIGIEGQQTEIQPEMVTFNKEIPDGYVEIEYDELTVYVNYEMSEDIWNEQISREIQLRTKSMREELDLNEEDGIEVFITAPDEFLEAVEIHAEELLDFVGGREINLMSGEIEEAEYILQWEINGENVDIGLNPLYKTKMLEIFESIPGMNKEYAERLYEEGYTSLDKIKEATAGEIVDIKGFKRSLARRIVQTIKEKGDKLKNGELEKEKLESGLAKEKEKFTSELQKISGIGKGIAERITDKGYYSFEDISETSIESLLEIQYMKKDIAERLIDHSKEQLEPELQKKELKEEESKETPKEMEDISEKIEDEDSDVEKEEENKIEKMLPEGVERSSTYMITDNNIDRSFDLFKEILETGMRGMCITREYPKKIRNKYGLEETSIVWLSNVEKENAVRPKNLEDLSLKLENFLASGSCVILLNGLDYLTNNNDFRTILRLLQSLKDQVAITESILLVPISSKAIEDYQLDLLESEMNKILD